MKPAGDTVSLQLSRQELMQIKILLQVRKKRLERKIRMSNFIPAKGQRNADAVSLQIVVDMLDRLYEVEVPDRYR